VRLLRRKRRGRTVAQARQKERCSATQKGELLATVAHNQNPPSLSERKTIMSASRNIFA
jgi:hypothetical protein